MKKHPELNGINAMAAFGIAAIVVGFGFQAWDVGRKKEV